MFKKIVSQLSFSPALVGQLGFYAKRLRKEEATRRLGLIFVALALVVQSLVVFQAPEAANASSNNDFIVGGLGTGSNLSLNNFLRAYDSNSRHMKDIFTYAGITRNEITSTTFGTFVVGSKKSYGFENRAGSTAIDITDSNWNTVTRIYGRPMTVMGNQPYWKIYGYIGHSQKAGWFAIMQVCGNLVTDNYPTPPVRPKPANIVSYKTGTNVTQGNANATTTKANANDKITYTVTAGNTGGTAATIEMKDTIGDVMKYARLINTGGGVYSAASGTLSWGNVSVGAGKTVTKQYTVQMNSSLVNKTTSCSMKNTFLSASVTVNVNCTTPPAKIESVKSAVNITQKNADATKVKANANDKIRYSVTVSNTGGTTKTVDFVDNISDVLSYAKVTDKGGATLDETAGTLSWGKVTLGAGEKIMKQYEVQVNSSLVRDTTICNMKNTFLDSSVTVALNCSTAPANVGVSKTATNVSQGNVDATTVSAKENDRITFTLTAENTGGTAKKFTFEDTLSDALEYATVTNNGGGTFNESTKKLTWPEVTIEPGKKEIRTFTMQILSAIPATPQGISDKSSYDCRIENTFDSAYVVIPVNCPAPKVVEQTVTELPHTGPRANVAFAVILFAVVAYFYARSRQLNTEVRLIRRDLNGGTL